MVDQDGWEIERGLSGLGLESVYDFGIVLFEVSGDLLDGTWLKEGYLHLIAMMKLLTAS